MGGWLPPECPPSHGGPVLVVLRDFPHAPAYVDVAEWTFAHGWRLVEGRSGTIYPLCWTDPPPLPAWAAGAGAEIAP